MKNIKKITAALMVTGLLMVGQSFGQKGVMLADFAGTKNQTPCTQETIKDKKGVILQDLTGVIVNGFTGVIVNGFTGVIVNGFTGVIVNDAADTTVNCGVIVNG